MKRFPLSYILIGIVSLCSIAMVFYLSLLTINTDRDIVYHHEIYENNRSILLTMNEAETGQRGYLITRNKNYLNPYTNALKRVNSEMDRLKHNIDPVDFDSLQTVVNNKIIELEETIKASPEESIEMVNNHYGKNLMDDIRKVSKNISDKEQNTIDKTQIKANKLAIANIIIFIVINLLYLGFMIYTYIKPIVV